MVVNGWCLLPEFYGLKPLKNNTMIKKDEILELMRIYQKEYDQYTDCIMFEDFDSIAESLVKLCNKHFVSNNEVAVCECCGYELKEPYAIQCNQKLCLDCAGLAN